MGKISRRKRQQKSSTISDVIENISTVKNFVSSSRALQCSAVFACIGLLSESIAQLPIKVYEISHGEKRERRDHWVYNLLARRPCSWLTSFNWRELAMMCLCLRGDFYAYKVRDGQGRVIELLPLLPGAISVRQLNNWELEYRVIFADGTTKTVTQADIFHVMYRSLDGVKGLSPIACERQTIGLALSAQEHGANVFANGARPGGILSIPGQLSKEAYERLNRERTAL